MNENTNAALKALCSLSKKKKRSREARPKPQRTVDSCYALQSSKHVHIVYYKPSSQPDFIDFTLGLMLLDMTMNMLAIKVLPHLHDFALGVEPYHIHHRVAQRLA